ncbi:MAG: hypothetical protein ACT4QA_21675 [Panacagrimonas sp.]
MMIGIKSLQRALLLTALAPLGVFADSPQAVPTYESIGLYWRAAAPSSSSDDDAQLQYRRAGTSAWQEGLPLWFDRRNGEYRGSLVHLNPGQRYEVRMTLDNGTSETLSTSTWSNDYPIGRTVRLPANSNQTLTITEGGSPSGYALYTAAPGSNATIDVNHQQDYNIVIKASYVIIRGLTLRGAKQHVINIGPTDGRPMNVSDIVIENNDLSDWGSPSSINSRFGRNRDSGVFSAVKTAIMRVTIQRNKLHHPSTHTNSWEENHGGNHPVGPQPITLQSAKGGVVIRYNEIYSDANHYFNDGMGSINNFSTTGFPNQDSDIYGNLISYTRDNAIEAEGGNRNVRIWGNYFDKVFIPFGVAPLYGGPLYVWKNVTYSTNSGPRNSINGSWIKMRNFGAKPGDFGGGRLYLFNNTAAKPRNGEGTTVHSFLVEVSQRDRLKNIRTSNNIMQTNTSNGFSVLENHGQNNVFDYDVITSRAEFSSSSHERNGVFDDPVMAPGWGFNPSTKTGKFSLDTGTAGYDEGTEIPNFVTSWTGRGPDMGAHEALTPPMEFGVNAYR